MHKKERFGGKTSIFFAFVASAQSGVDTFFVLSGYARRLRFREWQGRPIDVVVPSHLFS